MMKFGSIFDPEVCEESELLVICVFLMVEAQNSKSSLRGYIKEIDRKNPLFFDWAGDFKDECQHMGLME